MSSWLNTECTNPGFATNNIIDGMINFNRGFKFQIITYADTVKQYEVWPDNLAQQEGFFTIDNNNRKIKANSKVCKMLSIANKNKFEQIRLAK